MVLYLWCILFILSFSCGSGIDERMSETFLKNTDNRDYGIKFKKFITKFKSISYPFTASTGCYDPDTSFSVPLVMENDSIFIDYTGPAVTVGIFPDTSNFYAVVYCTAAACYIPTLATYTKTGTLISKKPISTGCGSDLGYECSETLTIYSLNEIVSVYVQEYYDYDDSGNEVAGSRKKTVDTNIYSINEKGVIKVSTSRFEK